MRPDRSRRRGSRGIRPLTLESLETRINLSLFPGVTAGHAAATKAAHPAVIAAAKQAAVKQAATTAAATSVGPTAGASATILSGATSVPVNSYSDIDNCQLELISGQTSPDIGYVSTGGAWVEYTVSAPAAGLYTLSLGLASLSGANMWVDVNGVGNGTINAATTGAWTSFASSSMTLNLSAGNNVIRIVSQPPSQYNINAVTLTPQTNAAVATTSSAITVGDTATLPIASYSAIYNSALEFRNGPDIGYVSPSGAWVEYTINVATAGNYNLSVGTGGMSTGTFDVHDNGNYLTSFTSPATGSWSTYNTQTQSVFLSAGAHVLRFVATNGTQYNLFSIGLSRSISAPIGTVVTAPASGGVSVTQKNMTSFTELDITGTPGNDSILVTQSGSTITITADGTTQQVTGTFGDIAIWGGDGNDTITVDSSVTEAALVYGGNGNNVLTDSTRGKATIVSYGGGADIDTGNFINTSFWVDNSDTVNASAAEIAAGRVHRISGFYQPYTSTPGAYGYVTNAIDGANLVDPASAGTGWTRLTNSSLWGTGPQVTDVNQGSANDCYFLTALQSLAKWEPDKLQEMAVDLGDGTYAVQFTRNGVTSYVRVDGDLPTGPYNGLQYNHPGASGNQWASIMEKAYAFFRNGGNSYASLDIGWMVPVYWDLGISSATTYAMVNDQNSFYNTVSASLAADKPVDIGTLSTIVNGTPLIGGHTYSVMAVSKDATGTVYVTLRNPWGWDGFNDDSNEWDGLVTITYATLRANSASGSIVT